ncbi:MAG TPA: hypothetical protein EYM73_13130 [Dehalococcoidia bacterium]|nr:hypothetical protein [Dehalococcoidia bacterium]
MHLDLPNRSQRLPDEDPERKIPGQVHLGKSLRRRVGLRLEGGLEFLSPNLRAAVVLRDIQGLSTEESAEALDISIASLKSRLHRARILLRKHLESYSALSLLPDPETSADS